MGFVVLITWFAAVLLGLFMLAVWLIENDVTDRTVAPSRLPVLVVFSHLLLAATGLGVWVAFLLLERWTLAWTAIGILVAIAMLGAAMFLRWIPVYRGPARLAGLGERPGGAIAVPAERNFPVVVVTVHGLLAVSTLVLALLTALRVVAAR
jgi:manganese efflux pump family protein